MVTEPSNDNLLPASSWDFHPAKERFKENAISMGVAVGYGVALAQIFNPIVLGVAAAGATLWVGKYYASHLFAKKPSDKIASMPGVKIPANDDPIANHYGQVADVYSSSLKLPKMTLLYLGKETLFKGLNLFTKLVLKRFSPESLEKALGNYAAAFSLSKTIGVSNSFFKKHTNKAINFMLAHEMAHLKARDVQGFCSVFKHIKFCMGKVLWPVALVTTLTVPFVGLIGLSFPSVCSSIIGFAAASFATNIGINYVSRIKERRADRNAIFLTRDMPGAEELVLGISENETLRKKPNLLEIGTHPSLGHRLENLRNAFELASKYEPVELTLPEPPKEILVQSRISLILRMVEMRVR